MRSTNDQRESLRRLGARIGMYASALIVFGCGWLAMQSSDWKRVVILTALAAIAGLVASQFARRAR